jgi:hypothetical protein
LAIWVAKMLVFGELDLPGHCTMAVTNESGRPFGGGRPDRGLKVKVTL